mmetsp:Transcript_20711/g.59907  ORF Transcript_20711/g.59907 Transcript_20711/m.59907 type:complete len:245 (-) Transcript_20711:209-943(-)
MHRGGSFPLSCHLRCQFQRRRFASTLRLLLGDQPGNLRSSNPALQIHNPHFADRSDRGLLDLLGHLRCDAGTPSTQLRLRGLLRDLLGGVIHRNLKSDIPFVVLPELCAGDAIRLVSHKVLPLRRQRYRYPWRWSVRSVRALRGRYCCKVRGAAERNGHARQPTTRSMVGDAGKRKRIKQRSRKSREARRQLRWLSRCRRSGECLPQFPLGVVMLMRCGGRIALQARGPVRLQRRRLCRDMALL